MKRLLLVLMLFPFAACGGGGPTAPSSPLPTPTPTPTASKSSLTLGASNNTFTIRSTTTVGRLLLKCGDFHVDWLFTESAGLRARIVRSDTYLRELDGDIEGRVVREDWGDTGIVPANSQLTTQSNRTSECGYEGRDFPAVIVATIDLVDDRNNRHTLTAEVGFVER